ncbi:MAG: contact-dependent growth inhibition system immunity protein [Ruminococcus flavefaciens]|nr:contact-dependent growth inhibition system immunity protein [Ruminococcus flavefaciens]
MLDEIAKRWGDKVDALFETTIYELKGIKIKDIKQDSPLDKWFYEMVQKKVNMLTIGDITRMLRQEVYLDIAVPLAEERLLDDPLCGEMYDGEVVDLLTRILIKHPSVKKSDFYMRFEKKVMYMYETYEWDSDYEKTEYEKIISRFRQLFM